MTPVASEGLSPVSPAPVPRPVGNGAGPTDLFAGRFNAPSLRPLPSGGECQRLGVLGTFGLAERLEREQALRAMRSVLGPSVATGGNLGKNTFRTWLDDQIDPARAPHLFRTAIGVTDLVRGANPPRTVKALLEQTRALAAKNLEALSGAPKSEPERGHLVTAMALIGLAAHAQHAPRLTDDALRTRYQLPLFLHDGRLGDLAFDKTNHLVSHAFFAFITLYDDAYGDGSVSKAFHGAAGAEASPALVARLEEAYRESEGRVGPLVTRAKAAPLDDTPAYREPPRDLSSEEARAYWGAVYVGHAHEIATSARPIAVDDIGLSRSADGEDTTGSFRGLEDPGVGRDLLANRLGAELGVRWFRDPTEVGEVLFDGPRGASAPFCEVEIAPAGAPIPIPSHEDTHARGRAVRNALARGDTTPERLVDLVLAATRWDVERPGQIRRMGAPVKIQHRLTEGGFVIERAYAGKGLLRVRLDTADVAHRERGFVSVRIECYHAGRLHLVRELPTTVLPTARALREEQESHG